MDYCPRSMSSVLAGSSRKLPLPFSFPGNQEIAVLGIVSHPASRPLHWAIVVLPHIWWTIPATFRCGVVGIEHRQVRRSRSTGYGTEDVVVRRRGSGFGPVASLGGDRIVMMLRPVRAESTERWLRKHLGTEVIGRRTGPPIRPGGNECCATCRADRQPLASAAQYERSIDGGPRAALPSIERGSVCCRAVG